MPEIKIKHVISFSSEDKLFKAENLLKPETYRKWKCAIPGEKSASILLQLEKASQIHSIDIGNEHSAFVEILVGRSSDSSNDYQVLLGASSFMSPLESRNGTNINRVRMFGPDKLAQNLKDEKWDVVQLVCTQPFNKTVQYGLTFVKFHSPPDTTNENLNDANKPLSLGAFKLKSHDDDDDDDEETSMSVGSLFAKRKEKKEEPSTSPAAIHQASSFAAATLASNESKLKAVPSPNSVSSAKQKQLNKESQSTSASSKGTSSKIRVNREKVGHVNIQGDSSPESGPSKTKKPQIPTPSSTTERNNNGTEVKVEKKLKKKKKPAFNQIMRKVIFVLSGFQNPIRSDIRDCALEMGAKYKGDWDASCTHLICAFLNTPKYNQVRSLGGRVVRKEWILDCHKKKELLPWRKYMLGRYSKSSTTEEESEDEEDSPQPVRINNQTPKPLAPPSNNIKRKWSPKKSSPAKTSTSVKVDEDSDSTGAEIDYLANTDVDSSSEGDTDDEIRRVQLYNKNKRVHSPTRADSPKSKLQKKNEVEETSETKQDTSSLPLPELPDYFKKKQFFLYGSFSIQERHDLERYITAYNGTVVDYMGETVKYVVTSSKWNKEFDEALAENENLIFVHPKWIHKCHESKKLVPFQPHIVVPEE